MNSPQVPGPIGPSDDPDAQASWNTFNQLMAVEGHEFEFKLGRSAHAWERDTPAKTFSVAAMNTLNEHLMMFIGTRMMRFQTAHDGRFAGSMTVRIRVMLEDEPPDWDAEVNVINVNDEGVL